MIATIVRRTKAIQWSEAFASRETAAVAIRNDDDSAFDATKTYVLAITDQGTDLGNTEDDDSTALTLSDSNTLLSGELFLGGAALLALMAASLQDRIEYRAHIVSKDSTKTLATDDVTIQKTDFNYTTTTTTTT